MGLNGPVWLAFHHEPEGDGAIQDWRRMQEHLTPIVRAHRNLAMTVIVTGWNQFYGESKYRLKNIWPRGVNVEGLKRRGFDAERIGAIRRAYKALYVSGAKLEDARDQLASLARDSEDVRALLAFIDAGERPLLR